MTEITENTRRIIEKEDRLLSYTTRVPYYPLVVDRAKGSHVWDVTCWQARPSLTWAIIMKRY